MIKDTNIRLKKFTEQDRDFYKRIYSDPTLMKFISKPLNDAACNRSFDLILKRMASEQYLLSPCIIQKLNSNFNLGVISLKSISKQPHTCEIGVIILNSHQRNGYAHKAKSILIQSAFQLTPTIHIVAICDKNNNAANLANKKLGFKKIQEYLDKNDNTTKIKWQISKQDYNDK